MSVSGGKAAFEWLGTPIRSIVSEASLNQLWRSNSLDGKAIRLHLQLFRDAVLVESGANVHRMQNGSTYDEQGCLSEVAARANPDAHISMVSVSSRAKFRTSGRIRKRTWLGRAHWDSAFRSRENDRG